MSPLDFTYFALSDKYFIQSQGQDLGPCSGLSSSIQEQKEDKEESSPENSFPTWKRDVPWKDTEERKKEKEKLGVLFSKKSKISLRAKEYGYKVV